MPGEEDADLVMDSAVTELAPNTRCPLSYKPLLELADPVKCVSACYGKAAW